MKEKFFAKMDYLVLFILNAAGMILELVASRLLSPYFGNSNFVWTAIIGIILLAGSLGNLIGGKLASKNNARAIMGLLLLFAVVYLAITPLVDAPILKAIKDEHFGTQFSAVLSSIVFFLVPSTILGIITPIIMKERIGDGEDKGKESGKITAIIAIGSLVGTFIGGFFIIPALGTKMILVLLALTILVVIPIIRPLNRLNIPNFKKIFLGISLAVLSLIVVSFLVVNSENGKASAETSISVDTEYGRIIIEEKTFDGVKVRFYRQSGAYSSATYVSEEKKYDLFFEYLKKYDEMFSFINAKNVAMIGGAAYQYPKYFIANFPDARMDVIEIDPVATQIAKEYFYLNDLLEDYGSDRLGLYDEDGRVFMANGDQKYDAILNDAFSGEVPVGTLATVEAASEIRERLNFGGVYMSNVLGAIAGNKGRFLRSEVKTLRKVFRYVYVLPVISNAKSTDYVNWMVVATDSNKYVPADAIDIKLSDEDIVLTDDYCPVDALISTEYFD